MSAHGCDVVIFGAGPAGLSAGITLLNHTQLSVWIVEQSNLQSLRVGESVSASIFSLLDYLQLSRDEFPPTCFLPTYSSTAYWGSDKPTNRESLFSVESQGYQLDRQAFDFSLMEKFTALGGHLLPRCHIQQMQPTTQGWQLRFDHVEQGSLSVECRFILDASGRQTSLAPKLGIRYREVDRLTGVGLFMQPPAGQSLVQEQWIESTELGWWYCAATPGNQWVVTFFSDADLLHQHRLNRLDCWLSLLASTHKMKNKLAGARTCSSKLWLKSAASKCCLPAWLSGYLPVGDAALAFDPITSMGLGFAMTSGAEAARIVASLLGGLGVDVSPDYWQQLNQHFQSYLKNRQQFYTLEQRWSSAPFWHRRHGESKEPASDTAQPHLYT
ncbi:lysine-epsilon-oxidase maturase LodB [Bowmanella denitrificans]|uniref:lysine-epsilon-oxidase maturase LodB n=1 Tax=Bowmanella denitrificans TaxID=366582 RepID=UPI000C9B6572|nr:lysine-epsilon-oxidase maturase LodB [Bowmanella denitrificans]